MKFVDCFGSVIEVGDTIAYASTRKIWVGEVTALLEYGSDHDPFYKIQIAPPDLSRKGTVPYEPEKIYKVSGKEDSDGVG